MTRKDKIIIKQILIDNGYSKGEVDKHIRIAESIGVDALSIMGSILTVKIKSMQREINSLKSTLVKVSPPYK